MQNRVSTYPGRVRLVPVSGQENIYDMTRADEPTEVGTPLTKETFLSDPTAALYGLGSDAVPDDALWAAVVSNTGYVIVTTTDSSGEPVPGVPVLVDGEFVGDTGERGVARFSVTYGTHTIEAVKTLDLASVSPSSISVEVYSAAAKNVNFTCAISQNTSATVTVSGISGFSTRVEDFDVFLVAGGAGGTVCATTSSSGVTNAAGSGGGYTKTLKGLKADMYRAVNLSVGAGGLGGTVTADSARSTGLGKNGGSTKLESMIAGVDEISVDGGKPTGDTSNAKIGGDGGSGGGGADAADNSAYYRYAGDGGQDGSDGGNFPHDDYGGGKGQGSTTKAFGEPSGPAYSPGGGGSYLNLNRDGQESGSAQEGGSPGTIVNQSTTTPVSGEPGTLYGAGGGGLSVKAGNGTECTAADGVQGAIFFRWRYK